MSSERHKEISRSGGVASGKVRKERATMRECLESLLYEVEPTQEANEILDRFNIYDEELRNNAMLICISMIKKAIGRKCKSISAYK